MEIAVIVLVIATILLFLLLALFVFLFIRTFLQHRKLYNRFKGVVDIEREQEKAEKQFTARVQEHEKRKADLQRKEQELRETYKQKRAIYENLMREISILEDDLEFASFGIYKPHFDFDTSEKYKAKINEIRSKQKEVVRRKQAAVCATEWQVSGSKREGRKMTNRNIRLMLRAFNNECDAAVLKVRWNNVTRMEQRIIKAYEAINKLGETSMIHITQNYLNLKIQELRLAHEYQEKQQEEKEEQRRIREQIREEEKVQREIEQAKKEADREEQRYQKALEQARKEVGQAQGDELTKLNEQIAQMEKSLQEAQKLKQRAISRAQLTKSGHIYVISNIGSFGQNVYKIGMSRRMVPEDRVRELGDASVPFHFDIHAMIYSEDAPTLEKKLHDAFDDRRVNCVNNRKEFFKVPLDEIEKAVEQNHASIEFTKLAEAKEYRETLAIREQAQEAERRKQELEEKFPATL